MKKRMISLVSLALVFALFLQVGCVASASGDEIFIKDAQREEELLATYSEEISLVEENHGCEIEHIDAKSLEALKDDAVKYLYDDNYRFSALMDELSIILVEQEIMEQYEDNLLMRINDVVVKNMTSTTIHEYGPLKGVYKDIVPVNTEIEESVSVSLSITGGISHEMEGMKGDSLTKNISITTGGSYQQSVTLKGPNSNDTTWSGRAATHSVACGVLYGTVTHTSWDLCDRRTGEVKSHHESKQIQNTTSRYSAFVTLAQIDRNGRFHIDNPERTATSVWSSQYEFEKEIKEHVYKYVTGNESATCAICEEMYLQK